MTDKEKIKEEIERRIKEGSSKNDISEGALALNSLLDFIDSLPKEHANNGLEEAADVFYDNCNIAKSSWWDDGILHKMSESKETFIAGAEWQKKKDQETIELAEDHAMFAGIIKGTEHTISKVRSILNKVAYKNDCLNVNGDYCEQPYVELDNEFKKLLNDN
jgi:hypothetical protein